MASISSKFTDLTTLTAPNLDVFASVGLELETEKFFMLLGFTCTGDRGFCCDEFGADVAFTEESLNKSLSVFMEISGVSGITSVKGSSGFLKHGISIS